MSNEIQKFKPENYDEILKFVQNSGPAFKEPPSAAAAGLLTLVCARHNLIPVVDVIPMGRRTYITVAGLIKIAGNRVPYTREVLPTAEEVERLVKLNWASPTDTFAKVVAVLSDGTELEFFGTANAGNSGISKGDKRILARHALSRARHAAYTAITGFEAEDGIGNDFESESVQTIEVAPEPTIAKLPAAAPKKAPKPAPVAEPAPVAVAETEVIETTVAEEPPKTGTKPSKGLALGIRTYITQHRDKFPAHIAVTSAIEDFDTWLASENLEGDGWIAGQCLAAWHKNKATWLSVYGAPDDSEESLFNTLAKFTAAF